MAGLAPVELASDCPDCGLENGVVEVYDALVAACRFGLPARTRCNLCRAEAEGTLDRPPVRELADIPANRCPACARELGPSVVDDHACPHCGARAALTPTFGPIRLGTLAELEAALDAWAARDLFPSRDALLRATFVAPDAASLFAALTRGERLEVLADPFATRAARSGGGERPAAAPRAEEPEPRPARTTTRPPPSAPPRAIVFPLVSVIAADGEIHPGERALVDRFLVSEGLAPLADHEFTVHHPSSVAHLVPRERREEVVRLMCETAAIDGLPDESERRVIRAYAAAWHVDDEKLEFWMWGYENMNASLSRQLFLKLRRFVLSARWNDPEDGGVP